MFSFFRRRKTPLQIAQDLLTKGDSYVVNTETLQTFVDAVKYLDPSVDDVGIREKQIQVYRGAFDLLNVLTRINAELKESNTLSENFNLKQVTTVLLVDIWLVDDKNLRWRYYDFIRVLLPLIDEHIALLAVCEKGKGRQLYQGIVSSLYSVHCDLLSLAEMHIRYYSQR